MQWPLAAILVLGCSSSSSSSAPPPTGSAGSGSSVARAEPAPASGSASPAQTMHRIQAGTPDATGWYPARSEGGRFTVLMPRPFNDFSTNDVSAQGKPVTMHTIGTERPDHVKFSVNCALGGDRPPLEVVRGLATSMGPVKSHRELLVHGHQAVEIELESSTSAAVMRAVALPDRMCLLIVDSQAPGKQVPVPSQDAARMFDSFIPDR